MAMVGPVKWNVALDIRLYVLRLLKAGLCEYSLPRIV